jgi:acyl-[acyl carrier protein]--UDP-N-acetylglucosamine O-acyltransferase
MGVIGMRGWPGTFPVGGRPAGIHPWALIGAPPEHRDWNVGDPIHDPVIAGSALIDAFSTVDAGFHLPTRIGERSWLQKRVHVGHDSVIGDDVELCVGVVLGGHVTIGDGVRVGGNTWVKPRVRIGEGAIIGGGSVVTKDVPAHEVWAGNPARYMKNAWTHPDNWQENTCVAPPSHPLRDSDELWEHMRPWHHRDLERREWQYGGCRP